MFRIFVLYCFTRLKKSGKDVILVSKAFLTFSQFEFPAMSMLYSLHGIRMNWETLDAASSNDLYGYGFLGSPTTAVSVVCLESGGRNLQQIPNVNNDLQKL